MTTVRGALRSRVAPGRLTVLVALVDLALIGVFVLLGELSHSTNPFSNPLWVAETYAQFLIGWVIAAVLGGLYRRDAWASPGRAIVRTVPAWIGAAALAQGVRATPFAHGNAALTLFLVSVGVGLALLGPWRVTLAVLTEQ